MLTKIWRKIRDKVDKLLSYDHNPPVVIAHGERQIIVSDGLHPEANAMALAMYSRSPKSFLIHLNEVLKRGWQRFISQYYVGYGHKSIGDCGTTTVCAENVSMLAAKAIQDWSLYNGQEGSTRYLDMANQKVLNPLETQEGRFIQTQWMTFYSEALEVLVPHLKEKYPILPDDNPKEYLKAINAKAFDIARGFLPAGCTTYVGWHTNLRQAHDHLKEMAFHPLEEIRETAGMMIEGLRKKYPNSFNFKNYSEQDAYLQECSGLTYSWDVPPTAGFVFNHTLDLGRLGGIMPVLASRPAKSELPKKIDHYGQLKFKFVLDFGSFRDIQRHRSCTQSMPLLTTDWGFNPWYLSSLPEKFRQRAKAFLVLQKNRIQQISDPHIRQYYIAMGYNVVCELTAGLPSAVYIAELRSTQAVHPTLRPIAQQMGRAIQEIIPGIALHVDYRPDEWSTLRGRHDIVKK